MTACDLRELRIRELRRRIGYVLQEPYLFDDTIARNIAFGEADDDPARVRAAAELADAADFIERLPLAYDTRIGESGMRLSGGQAQRISIARALYHRPPVLIFDEATSALDAESERAVKGNLDRMLEGRTAFIVAHRLSTIRDADADPRARARPAGRTRDARAADGAHRSLLLPQRTATRLIGFAEAGAEDNCRSARLGAIRQPEGSNDDQQREPPRGRGPSA